MESSLLRMNSWNTNLMTTSGEKAEHKEVKGAEWPKQTQWTKETFTFLHTRGTKIQVTRHTYDSNEEDEQQAAEEEEIRG